MGDTIVHRSNRVTNNRMAQNFLEKAVIVASFSDIDMIYYKE